MTSVSKRSTSWTEEKRRSGCCPESAIELRFQESRNRTAALQELSFPVRAGKRRTRKPARGRQARRYKGRRWDALKRAPTFVE